MSSDIKSDPNLVAYLQSQRWFAGKARTIASAHIAEHAEIESIEQPGKIFQLAMAEVRYVEVHEPERYLIAMARDASGKIVEALSDDAFVRGLLNLIRERKQLPIGSTKITGEVLPESEQLLTRVGKAPKIRRLGVEQSNTSIVFDDQLIMKLVRKIEPGVNPEYEVGSFLRQIRFAHSPPLLGALQLEGPTGTTLAVVHQYLPALGDGWDYTQRALRAGTLPANFLEEVRLLGQRIAEMHLALASNDGPAWVPEPLTASDFQSWSASIIGELGVTIALAARVMPELSELREKLMERARQLAHVDPSGQECRVHGDLHLGQVLRTKEDWKVFDFEGEPARGFHLRRAKHSPLKDVAGMLRSFAYADAVARSGAPTGSAPSRIAPLRAEFIQGYKATMGNSPLLPRGETFDVLLEALELEKLLYELRYEIQNRPDWVRIPANDLKILESNLP